MLRLFLLFAVLCTPLVAADLKLRDAGPSADPKVIELRGLAAGAFDPKLWQAGKLNFVRESRQPFLDPRPGKFRNIYAPSIVKTPTGWTIFYGAWDGVPTGNDRIYRTDTPDFLSFDKRRTVIDHNIFQHVCNVSATYAAGQWALMCTAYPDEKGLNKPAAFFSKDGEKFVPATLDRIIKIEGYDKYAASDINGMNVLLREDGKYRLYFNNFKDFGKTYRATSDDGMNFKFEGVALEPSTMVNDVKKLKAGNDTWYLMGLHQNGDRLFYSLSRDGMKFPPAKELIQHAGDADKYMVAIGFVADETRVLGFLYGAGAVGSLDQNRIFAVWLQKKVTIDDRKDAWQSLGPDRQILKATAPIHGRLKLSAEDGATAIGSTDADLQPGRAYELVSE